MTKRELVKDHLLRGHGNVVSTGSWMFSKDSMACHEFNCCTGTFTDIDDCLDNIEFYADGDWDDVDIK